jgi:putative ABC transport system ATP-binding protein
VNAPVLDLDGVGRTYPGTPPVPALHPVDLRVDHGEYVTVVGPSGSGKSTFLNLLGLLDTPTYGVYRLDGIDTRGLDDRDRTSLRGRRIGFVFQAFHLVPHRSAAANVTMPLFYTGVRRRDRRARVLEILDQVGLAHRAYAPVERLSCGERQRVAIARGLINRPSLLLCDEPTGNLDSGTAAGILGLIERLHRDGMTVLLVTHDLGVAARSQRSLQIRDGVLTEVTPGTLSLPTVPAAGGGR